MDSAWVGILVSTLHVFVAILIPCSLFYWTNRKRKEERNEYQRIQKLRLANSFITELGEVYLLLKEYEKYTEEKWGSLFIFPFSEKYTEVYSGTSVKIGEFPEECSEALIRAYFKIKAVFEEARILARSSYDLDRLKAKKIGIIGILKVESLNDLIKAEQDFNKTQLEEFKNELQRAKSSIIDARRILCKYKRKLQG